jgi:hypothetical protein
VKHRPGCVASTGPGLHRSGTVNGTGLGKDGAHGIHSLHLGPAAFRFDVAGRVAAANPRFEAGMSGPLAGLFDALLGEMSGRNEFSVFIDDAKSERILRGLFDTFDAESGAEVVFDTSRGWCQLMPAISRLFPDAKVIACVRDLPWVVTASSG